MRRADARDAAELAQCAARLFEQTYAAELDAGDIEAHISASFSVERQRAELCDPSVVTTIVRSHDEFIAYAQVRRRAPPRCVDLAETVELHRFYLDRIAHGSGLAAALMQEARKAAQELGGRHLWLGVWERNARAIAFYGKAGFVDVGSTFYWVGPDKQVDRVLVAPVHVP
jgi:GNAT superfamily N-acetyltransferase